MSTNHPSELDEVIDAVSRVDANVALTKTSKEKTMFEQLLYSPVALNKAIKALLYPLGWATLGKSGKYSEVRVSLITKVEETGSEHLGFRAMDGVKNGVGLEIQFGKYAFMGYDILSKMPIFAARGKIDCGIEIVPMKSLSTGRLSEVILVEETTGYRMSTGVSYFEQIKADLEARGIADLDIPVLILGIDI
ncbi:MAG: BglII/BstYI family type II restriction endonuclease [Thermomicrobiales bacterium]